MSPIGNKSGYARLLEAWEPPSSAGDPVGCQATSFTFSPDFFQTECLSRFLALDTEPADGAAYFVEREEKLAQLNESRERGEQQPDHNEMEPVECCADRPAYLARATLRGVARSHKASDFPAC